MSRLWCLRALFPGTPPLSPLLTWASSPAPSFHFKGLALSGSHILLDDKLIKLDFLDEIDTKELQLPTGPKVNTALLAPIRVTKGYLRAIFLPARAEGWSWKATGLVKEKGLIKTHFSCGQVHGEPSWWLWEMPTSSQEQRFRFKQPRGSSILSVWNVYGSPPFMFLPRRWV